MIPQVTPAPMNLPAAFTPNALRPTAAQLAVQTGTPAAALIQAAALGYSEVVTVRRECSVAEVQAMNVTPIVIVAGVAGFCPIPVSWSLTDVPALAASTATPTFSIDFEGGLGTVLLTNIGALAGASVFPDRRFAFGAKSATTQYDNASYPDGLGIEISSSLTFTGGAGRRFWFTVSYYWARVDGLG
jgi:hypothetical protein